MSHPSSPPGAPSTSNGFHRNGLPGGGPAVPPSPPARRISSAKWLDPRLLVGVLLVVVSVAVGARVVSTAQGGELVWAAVRDLPAGATLQADDVTPRSVRLDEAVTAYIDASGQPPIGYVVVRAVGAGELVPVSSVSESAARSPTRLVSVPVEVNHYPAGLARGQRVDVYVVRAEPAPGDAAVGTAAELEAELVLEGATVADVSGGGGGLGSASATIGVVLSIAPVDVSAVVRAVGIGSIQLALIPDASQ